VASIIDVGRTIGFSTLARTRRVRNEIWEALIGPHFTTRSIQTLLNVGFFDALRTGPKNPDEFARSSNLNPRLLRALCESLYSRKVLTRKGSEFGLDELGRLIAENSLARGWFELVYGYEPALHRLEDMVRNQATYGKDLVREGKAVGVGSGLASSTVYFPILRQIIARKRYRMVLDIGCGDGAFLREVCRNVPDCEGVGLDLSPEAVAAGNQSLRKEGLSGRIRLHVGDAMNIGGLRSELKGVDAATTFFVLHELCDNEANARALQFLRSFHETLPGIPFYVIETVRPDAKQMRKRPGPAIEYFLFHDLSGQHPVGREALQRLFRTAGFRKVDEDYIAFARTSIYTAI